jgi:hypothetical protein
MTRKIQWRRRSTMREGAHQLARTLCTEHCPGGQGMTGTETPGRPDFPENLEPPIARASLRD